MKFFYIANVRLPTEKAHGLQIMKMCESFARQGAEVELVVPWRFNPIKEDPFDYYGIERNFKIRKIIALDSVKFGKIGFLIQSFSFAKSIFFYMFFKNPDIIYSRDALPLFFLSFFKKNLFWEAHAGGFNFIVERVIKKCRGVIAISQGLKDFYISRGAIADKILVAPDGVDLQQFNVPYSMFQAREKLNLPQGKKIILYTGSFYLYDWKGIDVMLKAAEIFSNDFLFLLVGGNNKEITQTKNKHRLENVKLVSHKPHKEIPYYLKAADVLVLPNKKGDDVSEKYTSPLKLFEYMASARPIVASNLPSIREVLNGGNAVLIEPNNPKALGEGINKILENAELADRISKRAYSDAKDYTWDKRVKNILNFRKKKMKSHFDYLLEHVPNLAKLSVLDVGSGRGTFLFDVAGHGGNAIGLEINEAYIKETMDRAGQNNLSVKVVKGMAEKLSFPDAAFDFVNFALVIEHIENPNLAVKEIARVMKIGGRAYVGVPNRFGLKDAHFHLWFVNWLPRSWCNGFITLFGKHKDYNGPAGRQNLKDMHYYTFGQIKKILNDNAFEVTDIREKKIKNYFKNTLFSLPFIFFYRIYRLFFSDSFHLFLKKTR
ncbi:MAG: group 1 glycosyl transferase [Candidatus Berkelbacteria bacterium Licking1014_85]|uniref:Group 1 glycosyl transferase n=1 Tax=Candidatus Berkelbacteria bacterium Licking1014_85 TaxID=2017148 RepID=A0A554LLE7_9BACT|nr:MAG: group 1 glycosyl transferase [Candidatus Berkelbacteria bacterium Licking1014_85]